jgi:Fe-S cluster assembly protein SufD
MGVPFRLTEAEQALVDAMAGHGENGARAAQDVRLRGLPSRRREAWKWSDLRSAFRPDDIPRFGSTARPTEDESEIAVLAAAMGNATIVRVPNGKSKSVLEDYSNATGFSAHSMDVFVGKGASFTRIVRASEGLTLTRARIRAAEGATINQFVMTTGGRLIRIETEVICEGEGVTTHMGGAYLVRDGAHADLTSLVRHEAVGCVTRQLVKGVARSGGRGVFQGKFFVARAGQQTDARMGHHALLLDERAEVNAKPELEIYADDVQCAHGNTAGAMDEAALFYMRQRGLPLEEARALLIEAFIAEAFEGLEEGVTRELILGEMRAWLAS